MRGTRQFQVAGSKFLGRPAGSAKTAKKDQAACHHVLLARTPNLEPGTGNSGPGGLASDVILVRKARDGDSDAFSRLVRTHLAAAHAVALAVLGEPADAEDVCQDAFVAALTRLEDCRPEEKFRPWLLTIVRNRAIDLRRKQRVRQAEPLEAAEAGTSDGARGPSPLRAAEQADARIHLTAAIATLTDARREVLLLHDLDGWTHAEIASHLGLAEGTTRAHLFWARRHLRARLSPEFRQGADDVA